MRIELLQETEDLVVDLRLALELQLHLVEVHEAVLFAALGIVLPDAETRDLRGAFGGAELRLVAGELNGPVVDAREAAGEEREREVDWVEAAGDDGAKHALGDS